MRSAGWKACRCSSSCAPIGIGLTRSDRDRPRRLRSRCFLAELRPAPSIFARHTVGLVDALTQAETAGKRLDDGLPESLEEVIAAYGHRYFKLKVAGSLDADIDRLARIAAVLDRMAEPYFATLDGNEQFEHVDAVIALWRRIGAEPRLARLKASILFVEQPIARAKALAEPIHALAREIPVEIDESDADIGVFPAARALGYRGISAKSCKGFYRALLNRARIARWNAGGGGRLLHVVPRISPPRPESRCSRTSRSRRWSARPMSSATATTMSTAWPARRSRNSSGSCLRIPISTARADGRVRLAIRVRRACARLARADAGTGGRRHAGLGCDATDATRNSHIRRRMILAGSAGLSLHLPEISPLVDHAPIGKPADAVLSAPALADSRSCPRSGRRTPRPGWRAPTPAPGR